jgi:hypothetical protein
MTATEESLHSESRAETGATESSTVWPESFVINAHSRQHKAPKVTMHSYCKFALASVVFLSVT